MLLVNNPCKFHARKCLVSAQTHLREDSHPIYPCLTVGSQVQQEYAYA